MAKQLACDVQCNVCLTRMDTRTGFRELQTVRLRVGLYMEHQGITEGKREIAGAHLAVGTAATRSRSVNHARTFHGPSTVCHHTKQLSSQPFWTLERAKWSHNTEKSLLTYLAVPFGPASISCNSLSPKPSLPQIHYGITTLQTRSTTV